MPRLTPSLLILVASAASAAPAAAAQQPPAPADQSPIVVTGTKTGKDGVRNFVRDLTPLGAGGQLSRFEDKVCPFVTGLVPTQNAAVAERIRQVARAAGIGVAPAKCAANVVLIIPSDKRAVLEELRRRHVDYFGDLSGNQIRAVIHNPAPIDAWQIQGIAVSQDGKELTQRNGVWQNRTTARGSRLVASARPQFAASVVVVAFDALDGLTLNQLADYVTLRALTGADPARLRRPGPPTILSVFDAPFGTAVPVTMTDWDFKFLRGYYDARRTTSAAAQRSAIARTISDGGQPQPGE